MLEWVKSGEAALSGTAAVLAGVGTLIYRGSEYQVANGEVGPLTRALRAQLVAIQQGEAPDRHGWLERVMRRSEFALRYSSWSSSSSSTIVVVIVLVVFIVPVLVLVFFLFGVSFGLGARPSLGFLAEFQVEFGPAVHIQFLDIAVEMLNFDDFLDLHPP